MTSEVSENAQSSSDLPSRVPSTTPLRNFSPLALPDAPTNVVVPSYAPDDPTPSATPPSARRGVTEAPDPGPFISDLSSSGTQTMAFMTTDAGFAPTDSVATARATRAPTSPPSATGIRTADPIAERPSATHDPMTALVDQPAAAVRVPNGANPPATQFERLFRLAYQVAYRLDGDRRNAARLAARTMYGVGGQYNEAEVIRVLLDGVLSSSPSPSADGRCYEQHRERLRRDLLRHPGDERVVLALRHLADHTPDHVARVLGINGSMVRRITARWVRQDAEEDSLLDEIDQWLGGPTGADPIPRGADLTHLDDRQPPARAPRSIDELPPLASL